MAADAQRLFNISMGKITASRGQRGGINLHKNLLVATVLTKAKTIIYLENYHYMMESRRIQLDSEENMKDSVENCTTTVHEEARNDEAPNGGLQHQQPSCMYSAENMSPRCGNIEEDKENSPPNDQHQELSKCEVQDSDEELNNETNCVRCTKRRYSEDDFYSLDSENNHMPISKKCKTDFEVNNDQDHSVPKSCEAVPMQTETTQITNLVNSFSSGFTGLLNHESRNTSTDQGYSSAEEDDEDDDVFTPNPCTKSENSLISCSTQIKEAFETLARPCIALTV